MTRPKDSAIIIRKLQSHLAKGLTLKEAARLVGIRRETARRYIEKHDLVLLPRRYIYITDLMLELNLSRSAIANNGQWRIIKYGRRSVVTAEEAERIRAHYRLITHDPATGWITSEELAALFGVKLRTLLGWASRKNTAIDGVARQVAILKRAPMYLWQPADAIRASQKYRAATKRPPHGISVKHLSVLLGVREPAIRNWVKAGCPHYIDKRKRIWFYPPELKAFLSSRHRLGRHVKRIDAAKIYPYTQSKT